MRGERWLMARIRTIKPEFFTSEDIVLLSPLARLLYIALWCEADREGRMQWKPRTFKMRYFPADDCDIERLCDELVMAELVKLYGDGYAYVPKFGVHQHLNPREAASQLPNPHASARVIDASARVNAPSVTRREEGKGKEGDRRVVDDDPSVSPAPPPVAEIPLADGSEYVVTATKAEEWSTAFPAVDVPQKLLQIRQWCLANPARRKTKRGVETFIVTWLGKEQDSGKNRGIPRAEDRFAGAL